MRGRRSEAGCRWRSWRGGGRRGGRGCRSSIGAPRISRPGSSRRIPHLRPARGTRHAQYRRTWTRPAGLPWAPKSGPRRRQSATRGWSPSQAAGRARAPRRSSPRRRCRCRRACRPPTTPGAPRPRSGPGACPHSALPRSPRQRRGRARKGGWSGRSNQWPTPGDRPWSGRKPGLWRRRGGRERRWGQIPRPGRAKPRPGCPRSRRRGTGCRVTRRAR
mmetsp:Transcript_11519/g.32663  ORF Transcript_11519/g.32663 Transcript_11519/m.32663 type:complete len:218 (+) Transcript_11519:323-976(+)